MRGSQETIAVLMAAVLTVSIIGAVVAFGAGSVAAVHPEDATDVTDSSNFTINLPYATDHYPGSQNEENGSIEYFASGEDAFAQEDAEEGVYIDWIIVHAEYDGENWIDYSACSTENTESFGIDRGNDNEGTQTDEDLVERQKETEFRDDGIVIEFFNWEDIAGDPPYIAPEDAVVASQGAGSAAGPCLTLTDEPGWYRIAGFMNGTVADNGEGEEPSEDAKEISIEMGSTFTYVCECENEEEAREQLGPPPSEGGEGGPDGGEGGDGGAEDGEETPEETEGGDDGEAGDDGAAGEESPEETEGGDDGEAGDDGAAGEESPEETEGGDDGEAGDDGAAGEDGGGDQPAVEDETPTESDDMPGFGVGAALVALLASAFVLYRRD